MPEKSPQFEVGEFLKKKYWGKKEFREAVEDTAEKRKRQKGEPTPLRPEEQISFHLERLGRIVEEKGGLFMKLSLYPEYIVKPENITDEYIRNTLLGNFAELKGYSRDKLADPKLKQQIIELFEKETGQDFETFQTPEKEREQIKEQTIIDQKESLDRWFEYLTREEARHYPKAFRYWAFAEVLKLGVFDKERKDFAKRTKETVAPFPELNQQALALVLDELTRKYSKQPSYLQLDEKEQKEFQKRLQSESFGRLYAWALEYVRSLELPEDRLVITQGEWRRFPRNSNPGELTETLQGFNTGWCIAGLGTAQSYLNRSDVLIYYSQDKQGKNAIPRAAVVTDGSKISEVRGILQTKEAKQHLDSYITPVVEAKLKELAGGKEWQKSMEDMKKLAEIHFKHLQEQPFSKKDLIFLYEVESPIKSAGYGRDPRIGTILKGRDLKEDLSFVLGVFKERISVTKEEALKGDILFHYGNLDLDNLTSAEGLKLPEQIRGDLDLDRLTSAKGLKLPEQIGGYLDLSGLASAEELKLPEQIGGDLYLSSLTSAKGLKLSEQIGGDLYLSSLTSAKGLKLSEQIGGNLYLFRLASAKGLKLPEQIGGSLNLGSLTSAEKNELRKQHPNLEIF